MMTARMMKVKLKSDFLSYPAGAIVDLPAEQAAIRVAAGGAVPWPPPTDCKTTDGVKQKAK